MTLYFQQGGKESPAIELGAAPVSLGRETTNTLVFSEPTVSNDHATLWIEGGNVLLRDRGSTNGTFVNDTRIRGTVELHAGDLIRLGAAVTLVLRGRLDGAVRLPQAWLVEDISMGVAYQFMGTRFHIGSSPSAHLQTQGSEYEAALSFHDGEVWLATFDEDGPIEIGEPFTVGERTLRVLPASARNSATVSLEPEAFPYRLVVSLDGASGASATLEHLQSGTRHVIAAENRAVLLYVLARRLLETRKKGEPLSSESAWCNDDDVARDIWGKKGSSDANSLHVLVHRLRKEIKNAGFDPWFIEKRRRAIRVALADVVIG